MVWGGVSLEVRTELCKDQLVFVNNHLTEARYFKEIHDHVMPFVGSIAQNDF